MTPVGAGSRVACTRSTGTTRRNAVPFDDSTWDLDDSTWGGAVSARVDSGWN
ncbi:hypothetical protein [Kitasatospora cineracea]|uniref:hypothetical protein n=1 Tax=Kitasatospora cineracea TaxID=88074 RepID=UPI0037B64AC3